MHGSRQKIPIADVSSTNLLCCWPTIANVNKTYSCSLMDVCNFVGQI